MLAALHSRTPDGPGGLIKVWAKETPVPEPSSDPITIEVAPAGERRQKLDAKQN
jgi:hypothetical protein